MIFEKCEAPKDLRITIIKPLRKKVLRVSVVRKVSVVCYYRGISLVSVDSKLLSKMILFKQGDAVDKVLREEQCGFKKSRGCVDLIFILRVIIEKCLSCQTSLVLSFIDFDQAFDSVDRRALAKVLSLHGIPDKYIKVISATYENNTAVVNLGNEVNSWFCIKSGYKTTNQINHTNQVKQGCVLSPFYMDHSDGRYLKEHRKGDGIPRIKWGGKSFLDINYQVCKLMLKRLSR